MKKKNLPKDALNAVTFWYKRYLKETDKKNQSESEINRYEKSIKELKERLAKQSL